MEKTPSGFDAEDFLKDNREAHISNQYGANWQHFKKKAKDRALHSWILQKGYSVWFRQPDGSYSEAIRSNDFFKGQAFREYLQWAVHDCLVSDAYIEGGKEKRKTRAQLLDEYGAYVSKVSASLQVDRSSYDPASNTLVERICSLAAIPPAFDQEIDTWLDLLGGDELKDWLAGLLRLDRPTCALLVVGEKGAGKGMLLEGLAQLWGSTAYTRLSNFLGKFNGAITACPLVGYDEGSDDAVGRADTKRLRHLIAASEFWYERKGQEAIQVEGCLRFIFTCNDIEDVLRFDEDLNETSRDAVAARFLKVESAEKPVEYLERLGGREHTNSWVAGKRLAGHVLWLIQNRQVTFGSRFLYEPKDNGDLLSHVALSSNAASAVALWLIRYMTEPDRLDREFKDYIKVHAGELWIYPMVFEEAWDIYMSGTRKPLLNSVMKAVSSLSSKKDKRRMGRVKGSQPWFKRINTRILFEQAERLGGDPQTMQAFLSGTKPNGKPHVQADTSTEAIPF